MTTRKMGKDGRGTPKDKWVEMKRMLIEQRKDLLLALVASSRNGEVFEAIRHDWTSVLSERVPKDHPIDQRITKLLKDCHRHLRDLSLFWRAYPSIEFDLDGLTVIERESLGQRRPRPE